MDVEAALPSVYEPTEKPSDKFKDLKFAHRLVSHPSCWLSVARLAPQLSRRLGGYSSSRAAVGKTALSLLMRSGTPRNTGTRNLNQD
ncbi:hypothetical protein EYF80_039521 [Liparis tanakae]|uniref:Uncharacterized protein n=1 Tax=Liparis tanakae TaxID=230148 RepID=A0A4Z2G9R1_9TELE|nr:hypothetical protein EYF80_039521 [Liparis tanakae]